ncbi:MAG: hypothetical protein WDN45_12435 [Caulobacteraceae bacterium]
MRKTGAKPGRLRIVLKLSVTRQQQAPGQIRSAKNAADGASGRGAQWGIPCKIKSLMSLPQTGAGIAWLGFECFAQDAPRHHYGPPTSAPHFRAQMLIAPPPLPTALPPAPAHRGADADFATRRRQQQRQ